jgi:uncharacterized repeat protein (TIGR02543 family)
MSDINRRLNKSLVHVKSYNRSFAERIQTKGFKKRAAIFTIIVLALQLASPFNYLIKNFASAYASNMSIAARDSRVVISWEKQTSGAKLYKSSVDTVTSSDTLLADQADASVTCNTATPIVCSFTDAGLVNGITGYYRLLSSDSTAFLSDNIGATPGIAPNNGGFYLSSSDGKVTLDNLISRGNYPGDSPTIQSFELLTSIHTDVSGDAGNTITKKVGGVATTDTRFLKGTSVELTASPTTGYTFVGWSGACLMYGSTAIANVAMNGTENCVANFLPNTSLPFETTSTRKMIATVAQPGLGTLITGPIDVGRSYYLDNPTLLASLDEPNHDYKLGENAVVAAIPTANNVFMGWSGDCVGLNPNAVVFMDGGNKSCQANFAPRDNISNNYDGIDLVSKPTGGSLTCSLLNGAQTAGATIVSISPSINSFTTDRLNLTTAYSFMVLPYQLDGAVKKYGYLDRTGCQSIMPTDTVAPTLVTDDIVVDRTAPYDKKVIFSASEPVKAMITYSTAPFVDATAISSTWTPTFSTSGEIALPIPVTETYYVWSTMEDQSGNVTNNAPMTYGALFPFSFEKTSANGGTGSVTGTYLTSSGTINMDCGTGCSGLIDPGTAVNITITPDSGSYLNSISGYYCPGAPTASALTCEAHINSPNMVVTFDFVKGAIPVGLPSINTNPGDLTVTAGSAANLTVVASGTDLSYQWQSAPVSGVFSDISLATSSSYTTPTLTVGDTGTSYRCVVTNTAGSVYSQVATVTVNAVDAPTAATPTFGPGAGVVVSGTGVAISTATSGSEIRYTLDGKAPSANSILYTGPIFITQAKTIKAIAIKSGYLDSAVATAAYTVSVPDYVITFDKNDSAATGTMTTQALAQGSAANLAANKFAKSGFTFAGWATSASGTVAYANQASYTMGGSDVRLFARWTANSASADITGNNLAVTKDGATVAFGSLPAGAGAGFNVTVLASETTNNAGPKGKSLVKIYDITPSATLSGAFTATVTLAYPSSTVYKADDQVLYWDGSVWSTSGITVISHTTSSITFKTTHFTEFAIVSNDTSGTVAGASTGSNNGVLPAAGSNLLSLFMNFLLAIGLYFVFIVSIKRTRFASLLS